jgi:guanidinopropionase
MDYKPLSGREFPRFSGIKTFFRLPYVPMDADYEVGIFGIPYDGGVSYRPGPRFAPTAVREMSSLGRGFHMTRELNYENIQAHVTKLLSHKKKFIACGGDHSTTLPVLRALSKYYGKPLQFIHFDAHLDTYPAAWGFEYHHGAFARHAVEEGLVDPKKMVQIGIRGPLAAGADLDFVTSKGIRVLTMDDIREVPITEFCNQLPKFDDTPTYISFDVDCLDPAYAPGTGTPVPGGMTSYEAQRILRAFDIPNLVGGDVVEISPPFDHQGITSLIGVDVMFEFLCIMAGNKK